MQHKQQPLCQQQNQQQLLQKEQQNQQKNIGIMQTIVLTPSNFQTMLDITEISDNSNK